jgi:hypothetical protein
MDVWQNSLTGSLKGNLASVSVPTIFRFRCREMSSSQLSGAKVLLINGKPPYDAVDANANITGVFQGLGTRQNSYVQTSTTIP